MCVCLSNYVSYAFSLALSFFCLFCPILVYFYFIFIIVAVVWMPERETVWIWVGREVGKDLGRVEAG